MSLKGWVEKKLALIAIAKATDALKEGGPMNPHIKEYAEGAIAAVLPAILVGITDALGAGNHIDWKVLAILGLSSLATYIRVRPTQQ